MQARRNGEEKTEAARLIDFIKEKQKLLIKNNADSVVEDLINKLSSMTVTSKRLIEEIIQALRIFDSVLDDKTSLPNLNIENDAQRRMKGLINDFERRMLAPLAARPSNITMRPHLWSVDAASIRKELFKEPADMKMAAADSNKRLRRC